MMIFNRRHLQSGLASGHLFRAAAVKRATRARRRYQTLKAGKIDLDKATITLPLYEGSNQEQPNRLVHPATRTLDKGNADQLCFNYSPKLTFADVADGSEGAPDTSSKCIFDAGTVDFSPKRSVTPGDAPNFFPPKQFQPTGVGDMDYTPLVKITNAGDHVYNAPVVAYNVSAGMLNQFCDGNPNYSIVHPKVLKICPRDKTVTMQLTTGFSLAKPVLYLSTDTNNRPRDLRRERPMRRSRRHSRRGQQQPL